MKPAMPPLPTPLNFPFHPAAGSQSSKLMLYSPFVDLILPTTRQIGSGNTPTGAGFAPAGSASANAMLASGKASVVRSAQEIGCGSCAAAANASDTDSVAIHFIAYP